MKQLYWSMNRARGWKRNNRKNMETKYLIIGSSIAGVSAVEGIREYDLEGKIVVVSEEDILNYSKPLISYYLGNRITRDAMSFRDKSFFTENNVKVMLNTKAEKIDTGNKTVVFNGNRNIKFQKLLISTGGKPIVPDIKGLEGAGEGVFTFTTISDAQRLMDYIETNKIDSAVVLGAGLIGLKCTEGLLARGIKVTIVELADRILANTFDGYASSVLEKSLNRSGCRIIKKDTVVRINSKKGKINGVVLKSGKGINTELFVVTVGVRPNMDILQGSGIKFDRGIPVDEFMRTSVPDIYAAGDVAQGKDFLAQSNSVIAVWPVASRQGKKAGYNMAGRNRKYAGFFAMNSVELAGVPAISFGITNPPEKSGYEILARKDTEKDFYRKIVIKENRIVGAILMNNIERGGIILGLIRDRIDTSSFKESLINDEFGLLVLPEEYRKHMVIGDGIEV